MVNKEVYKARVNDQYEFQDIEGTLDIVPLEDGYFHILKDNKSYKAKLLQADYNTKSFLIRINGVRYSVQLADQYDQLVDRLGLTVAAASQVKDIYAPMPGLVLEISVEVGQEVEEGTPLLILEAMKMENVIKSPGEGIIKSIHIKKGAAVEKNFLLIEME
jgi:biotin carboxyl carrier protein